MTRAARRWLLLLAAGMRPSLYGDGRWVISPAAADRLPAWACVGLHQEPNRFLYRVAQGTN